MRITTSLLLKRTKQLADETYPIYLRCTLDGRRIELSTGIYVDIKNWDEVKRSVNTKDPNARVLNSQLLKLLEM